VLLAAAFGVFQGGLVDQSLFNRAYLDDTEFASLAAASKQTLVCRCSGSAPSRRSTSSVITSR
jgi:hypothetical protein